MKKEYICPTISFEPIENEDILAFSVKLTNNGVDPATDYNNSQVVVHNEYIEATEENGYKWDDDDDF